MKQKTSRAEVKQVRLKLGEKEVFGLDDKL
jgi:hypothetical protein